MLKPSDLPPPPDPLAEVWREAIEAQFDADIRQAHATNKWPAVVAVRRNSIPGEAYELVRADYAAEGWRFEDPNPANTTYGVRYFIYKPVPLP